MINGINHITISVKNIDTAFKFYKNILKLKPVMKSNRSAYFLAGKIWIALDQQENFNISENYSHICFNISKKYYKKFVKKIRKNEIKEWQNNQKEKYTVSHESRLAIRRRHFIPCGRFLNNQHIKY